MKKSITEQALRERLAKNLRALRNKRGLNLKIAAERAEIYWRILQKIEEAEFYPTLRMMVQLAQSLSIDPAELL